VDDTTILDLNQAAAKLGSSVHFIRSLIADDSLKYIRIGKKFCIVQADLDRWVMANRTLRSEENGESSGTGCARRLRSVR
jgi:excisionase family DNA binding protein